MKKYLLALAVLVAANVSFARTVEFTTTLQSEYTDSVGVVTIDIVGEKVRLTVDRNSCSKTPDGYYMCTEMAFPAVEVTPIVREDARPVDGPLTLILTDEVDLIVSSGFTIDGKISYTARVKTIDGETVNLPLELKLTARTK